MLKSQKANKVWIRLFHPLPVETVVKVRNRSFRYGFYIGKIKRIIYKAKPQKDSEPYFYVIFNIYAPPSTSVFWVKPESIIEVIRLGEKK